MNAATDLLSTIWPDALDYDSLCACAKAASGCPALLHSVECQCVTQTHALVLEALARHEKVVVFGVDALPWRVLHRNGRLFARLIPLTSVVPTSSAAVWSSVLRGVPPYVHGLHGVVLYDSELGATKSVLSNTVFALSGNDRDVPEISLFLDRSQGVFRQAHERFGTVSHLLGLLALTPSATLARTLADGASWYIGEGYHRLTETPMELLSVYQNRIVEVLERDAKSGFIFCFLDLDTYLHEHTYTDPLIDDFLVGLSQFAAGLSRRFGACCFLISDHGMVRQTVAPGTQSVGRDPWFWERSYARPGGAGRIHFFYPKPDQRQSVFNRLAEQIGTSGIVLTREQYLAELAAPLARTVTGPERIGEIVAVATEPNFPSVMCSSLQEHGSLTVDEMIVGVSALP